MDFDILGIKQAIREEREALLKHPIYNQFQDLGQLRIFMEHHVFAVWDFMLLLKALQRRLTSVEEAWTPSESRIARRLINDIVLAEESDLDINGEPASHYEMYLHAMNQCGADTRAINHLVRKVREGHSLKSVMKYNVAELDPVVLDFIRTSWEIVRDGGTHEIAAAFTFGREDLIPDLFTEIVRDLNAKFGGELSAFVYYLERHIEIDGDEHGPMAEKMIRELCGNDQQKWEEGKQAAKKALAARLKLWDSIATRLEQWSPEEQHSLAY